MLILAGSVAQTRRALRPSSSGSRSLPFGLLSAAATSVGCWAGML